ncbi:PREDICTED: RING-H2 finger protein ATL2-like [Camelina sativa]|uniref:RING-type E3 ubiquitin transferase n=1 Tax=Camelina sativa TaxID=90675 RepID=A0ABM0YQZ2_CAMSA|nr:PREDICTED: RING-H2 finger protein ATL2-like [Camelina sativa]
MNTNDPDPLPLGRRGDDFSGSKTYAMSGKIMLSAIVILFFVVILMVFLHLYARWYLLRARRRHLRRRSRNRRATTMVFFTADPSTAAASSVAASRGLDPNVIKSLPVFTFSDETHSKDPIECAVCLSEFEENETGRVLPNCKHTFHVDCIDMWFHSHSTCPLCRSLVEPLAGTELTAVTTTAEEQVVIAIDSDPVLVTEPGSSSGLRCEPSGSSSSTTSADNSGRKPAAITVPRRNFNELEDEMTRRDSPASQSFRSPMSRMLSFTRMLSRDRRSASSPISGAPPVSPSLSCRIPVTESDIERGVEETR